MPAFLNPRSALRAAFALPGALAQDEPPVEVLDGGPYGGPPPDATPTAFDSGPSFRSAAPMQAEPLDAGRILSQLPEAPPMEPYGRPQGPQGFRGHLKALGLSLIPGYSEGREQRQELDRMGVDQRNRQNMAEYQRKMQVLSPVLTTSIKEQAELEKFDRYYKFALSKGMQPAQAMMWARKMRVPADKDQTPDTPFELWMTQNPGAAVKDWVALNEKAAKDKAQTTAALQEADSMARGAAKAGVPVEVFQTDPRFADHRIAARAQTQAEMHPPQPLSPWIFPSFTPQGGLAGVATAPRQRGGGIGQIDFTPAPAPGGEEMRKGPRTPEDMASKAGLESVIRMLPEFRKLAEKSRGYIGVGGGITGWVGSKINKDLARLYEMFDEMRSEVVRRGGAAIPKHEIDVIIGALNDPRDNTSGELEFFEGLSIFENEIRRKYNERYGQVTGAQGGHGGGQTKTIKRAMVEKYAGENRISYDEAVKVWKAKGWVIQD